MLLEKIITSAIDDATPISGLLRQCVVLGHDLKNDSLKSWANQELNGYPDPKKLPLYRVVVAGAVGLFNAGYAFRKIQRPIPALAMEEAHRWAAEEVRLLEPVSAYEKMLKCENKSARLVYSWDANLVVHYQEEFIPGHVLLEAWQEVSFAAIAGLLDTIRTRALNVALEIRSELGESDADLKKVEPHSKEAQRIETIVINNIWGGTVYVAGHQAVNTQTISVGDWEELRKALLAAGIKNSDIDDLSADLHQDGKTLGTRVKTWIGKHADKAADKGIEIGVAAGVPLLTHLIKGYLGIP